MSINTLSMADLAAGSPPLLRHETIVAGPCFADVALKVPASMMGPKRTEYTTGKIWATDQRVLLISDISPPFRASSSSSYDKPPSLTSIVVPYSSLQAATFHLPLFSPNNLVLHFKPDPSVPLQQTNLPDPGRGGKFEAKVIVGEGAGHGLWKSIEGERERWLQKRKEENTLPVYTAGSRQGETRLL